MKKLNCDILIIGGGLIGLITAYSLALLGFKIIVAEKKQTKGRYRVNKKNFFDIRTTAISEGSKEFLDKINLWGTISAFAEPIKFIDVIDRKETRKINFYNNNKNQNLGYIIENNLFSQSIVSKVNNNKKINYYDNTNLNHITYNNETITGVFDNFSIITKLIIAADGKNSTVRNISNIKTFSKKYNEKAIVMNIAHELDHRNHAYEFFFESGPLAILPMKEKPLNNFRSSLVWSHNKRFIDSLSTSSEGKIISVLEEQLQSIIGKVK